MNKLSWQYIYNLFVQAAEDVPSWAPEWVKKHPHFEQYKSLEDIPKSFPIKYYREPIQIEEGTKQEIQKSIDAHAGRLINGAASQVSRIIDNVAHFLERDNIFSINAILKEVNNSIKYYDEMFQNYFSKIEKVKNIILKINYINKIQ